VSTHDKVVPALNCHFLAIPHPLLPTSTSNVVEARFWESWSGLDINCSILREDIKHLICFLGYQPLQMLKWLIDRRNKWNKGFSHKALLGPKSQEKGYSTQKCYSIWSISSDQVNSIQNVTADWKLIIYVLSHHEEIFWSQN